MVVPMSGTTLINRTFDALASLRLAVLTMLTLGATPFTTAPKAPPHAVPAAS